MNTLLRLLRDNQVGTWCKRAAWLTLLINVISMLLRLYTLMDQLSTHFALPINWQTNWVNILDTVLNYGNALLFYFFILYAAGVALNHLVPSMEEDQDDEEEEIEQEQEQI